MDPDGETMGPLTTCKDTPVHGAATKCHMRFGSIGERIAFGCFSIDM